MAGQLNSDLFYLIKGLNSAEKSYYKKMASRHAANNNAQHIRLFDLIEKSSTYNEKKLQAHLNVSSPTQFSGLKTHLGKELLDTIVFLRRRDDPGIAFSFVLAQVEQLLEKKLLGMATKLFNKAWQQAVFFEQYDMQVQLLRLQGRMLDYGSFKEYRRETASIASRLHTSLHYQQMQLQLQLLGEQLQALKKIAVLRFTNEQHAEVLELKRALQSPWYKIEESKWTQHMQHSALATCEYMLFEFESCRGYCDKMLAFWQQYPGFINVYTVHFLNSANTAFYNLFALKDLDAAISELDAYSSLAAEYIQAAYYRKQWEIIAFNTLLKIYHKTGRYNRVATFIRDRAGEVMAFARQVLPPAEMLSVTTSICISYFVLEQFAEAEDLMFDIKELNRNINREDIFYFTTIFHLLIIYERGDMLRLHQAIQAAYHLLYSRKKLRPFEKKIMHFLRRLSSLRSPRHMLVYLKPFVAELKKYKNDPLKDLYFLYFNYYGWLESKMRNIKYRDYVADQIAETP